LFPSDSFQSLIAVNKTKQDQEKGGPSIFISGLGGLSVDFSTKRNTSGQKL